MAAPPRSTALCRGGSGRVQQRPESGAARPRRGCRSRRGRVRAGRAGRADSPLPPCGGPHHLRRHAPGQFGGAGAAATRWTGPGRALGGPRAARAAGARPLPDRVGYRRHHVPGRGCGGHQPRLADLGAAQRHRDCWLPWHDVAGQTARAGQRPSRTAADRTGGHPGGAGTGGWTGRTPAARQGDARRTRPFPVRAHAPTGRRPDARGR